MKNSDEKVNTGAFRNVKKHYVGGGGLTHLYVNNNWNESSNVIYILSDDYDYMIYTLLLIHGGGYYWEFLVGVCRPVLQILTLFQTKKCHFPHPFSDQISKIHTHFQTVPGSQIVRETLQFPPMLILCSCFLNSADPTISKPGTG